jgi:hypothetical protein
LTCRDPGWQPGGNVYLQGTASPSMRRFLRAELRQASSSDIILALLEVMHRAFFQIVELGNLYYTPSSVQGNDDGRMRLP